MFRFGFTVEIEPRFKILFELAFMVLFFYDLLEGVDGLKRKRLPEEGHHRQGLIIIFKEKHIKAPYSVYWPY